MCLNAERSRRAMAGCLIRARDFEAEGDYAARNEEIWAALAQAARLGYAVGFRVDPKEPDWPCAFIELPSGQVSWHMPQHVAPWDGHGPQEKWARCLRFVGETAEGG